MVSFPYYSHTIPVRIAKDMGMVWEGYHKGVPLLGVSGSTLEISSLFIRTLSSWLSPTHTCHCYWWEGEHPNVYMQLYMHRYFQCPRGYAGIYIDMQVSIWQYVSKSLRREWPLLLLVFHIVDLRKSLPRKLWKLWTNHPWQSFLLGGNGAEIYW